MAPRVLVVEDDPSRRAALSAALTRQGYAAVAAASAREAYGRVRAGQADALVVDHTLPDAPGLRLCARLRQDGLALPLVLVAAPADAALEARARAQLRLAGWLPAAADPADAAAALAAVLPPPRPAPPAGAGAALQPGTLAPFALARLLLDAWAEGATGTLVLARGAERRGIALLGGDPVALLPAAPLGLLERLAADGRIAPEEAEAFERRPEPRLLAQMGVLEPGELADLEAALLEAGLAALLAWDSGRYAFKPGVPALRGLPPRLALPRLVFAWVRGALASAADHGLAAGAGDRLVAPTARFFDALPFLDVGPDDGALLAALEEASDGVPIAALLGSDSGSAAAARGASLAALERLGLVERLDAPRPAPLATSYPRRPMGSRLAARSLPDAGPPAGSAGEGDFVNIGEELAGEIAGALAGLAAEPPAPAPPAVDEGERAEREAALRQAHEAFATQSYYEIFGLTPATYRYEAVKEAYFAQLKRFNPDFFVQAGSNGAVVSMAEEVVARLATAYNTLSNVVSKENYDRLLAERGVRPTGDKAEDALQAEVQYQSGKAFLARGDFEAAERALTTALDLDPRPEGYAHLAWAVFNDPRNRSSRSALDRAKGLLTRSLALKPTADAHAYRGAILVAEGKPGLAEVEFRKALRLTPGHRLAARELAALEERRAQEGKGLFRRLFR